MGFRDFHCFNKALLAKQCWRLWQMLDSLIARIMKAKYFPDCSILEAVSGKKPSFAWMSIQSACDLIREDIIWRVGNGETICIWHDKWLPNPSTYRVQSLPAVLASSATVSELIDRDTWWWNHSLLEQIFSPAEVKLILSIPISSSNQEDILLWRGTAKGDFSVRSTYHMQKEVEEKDQAECSLRNPSCEVWRLLWKLPVPNVEKNFLWKACHDDILPTRENLHRRKIIDDPARPICGLEAETTFHILWQCPSAMDVWCEGLRIFQKRSFRLQRSRIHSGRGK